MVVADVPWPVVAAPFIGSFLATLAIRLPVGEPIAFGRSACRGCGHRLRPRELIPLLSWLVQRGRCAACGGAIDPIHPIIEALAVVAAAWAWWTLDGALAWVGAGLGWCLLPLAAIDIRHQLLPDPIVLPLGAAGLIVAGWADRSAAIEHGLGAAIGGLGFLGLRIAYRRLRRREGLGLGDVKLAAAAGAWVGWSALPSVVLIAALSGLALALARQARRAAIDPTERLAFGPYLCLGIWLVWLHGPIPGFG